MAERGIAEAFGRIVGERAGIAFRAYDGSRSGPPDAEVTVDIRTPRAVRHIVQARNDLGLARAYITGGLEIHGDLHTALVRLWGATDGNVDVRARLNVLRTVGLRALRPVDPPPLESRQRGRRHSKRRDADAISHHYDVSNTFYRWLLGPSMAYTCAVFPDTEATLEEAQFTKHDLVCRKLGLRPGMRVLDVGCGWGGMVVHAARHYGVEILGVTLSAEQVEWGQRAIEEAGLGDRAEIRHLDYRDAPGEGYDAVSSIGLTEHVGVDRLDSYFRFLRSKVRPGGRLLNHCITRFDNKGIALMRDGFIDRYIFPDGELAGPGRIATAMIDAGFELRHGENLREHYSRTLKGWEDNLAAHWDDAVGEVGELRARVWRLYLVGSRASFDMNYLQLHQFLGVATASGDARMPLRPDWEPAARSPQELAEPGSLVTA